MREEEIDTILTFLSVRNADSFSEAITKDLSSGALDDAYRSLELTQVSFWTRPDSDEVVAKWEGTNIDSFLERFSTSSHPVLGKWRGLLRVLSGPEAADRFWDAEHHRLLSWASEEEGTESEVRIYRGAEQVAAYLQEALDYQRDQSLFRIFARTRREQGFTRIESWHQRTDDGVDVLCTLVEAHDLKVATSKFLAEDNPLDRRILKILRNTLLKESPPPPPAKLLARWHA